MGALTPLNRLLSGFANWSAGDYLPTANGGTGRTDGANLVPAGGATGQVLTKNSGTNYDTGWATPASGGGGGTVSDGYIPYPQFWRADVYNRPTWANYSNAAGTLSTALAANILYAIPYAITNTGAPTRIAINVTTAGASGTAVRIGLYNVAASKLPGTLIVDAGTVDVSTTGAKEVTISVGTLPVGQYYVLIVASAAATISADYNFRLQAAPGIQYARWQRTFTFGALPSDETAATYTLTGNVTTPVAWMRAA